MPKRDPVVEAARAHTNLNTFAAIVAILEGGCVYGPESQKAASRIIALCKAEQGRCLARYDRARAEAKEGSGA